MKAGEIVQSLNEGLRKYVFNIVKQCCAEADVAVC